MLMRGTKAKNMDYSLDFVDIARVRAVRHRSAVYVRLTGLGAGFFVRAQPRDFVFVLGFIQEHVPARPS